METAIKHFVTVVPRVDDVILEDKDQSVHAYDLRHFRIKEDVLDFVTTCGISIGGMTLNELTTIADDVTCERCARAPRFPLDVLNRTEL